MPSTEVFGIDIKYDLDLENLKCKAAGRRKRSACRTVSVNDRAAFRAGKIAQWIVDERAADFGAAWGLSDKSVRNISDVSGLTYEDLAEVHVVNFVPTCLEIEAGRHTCHPEKDAGLAIYTAARASFSDQIRRGKIRTPKTPRGPTGGYDPGTGDGAPIEAASKMGLWLVLVGVAALFLLGRS